MAEAFEGIWVALQKQANIFFNGQTHRPECTCLLFH